MKDELLSLQENESQLYAILKNILQAKEQIENNIIDLGYYLSLAKQLVQYGEWENWLADNVDFSVRTAQKYMKVADQYYDLREIKPFNTLNKSQLIALLDVKKDDREEFVTSTHTINGIEKTIPDMSIRELKEVIKSENKTKRKPKKIKNEHVDVSETDNIVEVEFKESNHNKLENLISEQKELEKELEMKRKQVAEVKKQLILENNLDLEIVFEEEVEGDFLVVVYFYMYIIRNNTKQFIKKFNAYHFETLELGDENGYLYYFIKNNKELLQEEKDFIMKKCYEMKDYIIARDKFLTEERTKENNKKLYEEIYNQTTKKSQEPKEIQDLKEEFILTGYKTLAKKYHPDMSTGDEEKFKTISMIKDMFLAQNSLKKLVID